MSNTAAQWGTFQWGKLQWGVIGGVIPPVLPIYATPYGVVVANSRTGSVARGGTYGVVIEQSQGGHA